MNQELVLELERLTEQIKLDLDNKGSIQDTFRLKQIQFLISIIKKYDKKITKGEELENIKGIGKGSIDRINEILKSGKLKEVKINTKNKKYLKQIEELEKVYGIGRKTAYDFVKNKGITSVNQLQKYYEAGKIVLPYHIALGLKYYNVYEVTIPRKEIDTINKYLQQVVKKIDPQLELTICGSYRRKKPFSNDIDILLTHKSSINYLKEFINYLHKDNFLLDDIDKEYNVKYMGFCKKGKYPVRRIDVMYIPYNALGSALLHFTGSANFNKKIREVAINLGFSLSQYGLVNKETGKKIKTKTEQDIFTRLGLEYILPEDRE